MIHRRTILTGTTLGALSLTAPQFLASAWGVAESDPYLAKIGLQLYTLRNQLMEDEGKTIQAVAKAGYKQVELIDVMDADAIVPLAKENGMGVTSAFLKWNLIGDPKPGSDAGSIEKCIETATKHQLKYLVFGYIGKGFRETEDQLKGIAERSNKAGELCKKAGLQLCYHHHSFEFQPLGNGKTGMDVFLERFDPALVPFEIDVFWAAIGGWDPVETLRKLKGRVVQVHLKDLMANTPTIYDEGKVPKEAFKEVGHGMLPMKKILEVSREIGVAQCHVEQDQSPNPIESVAMSMSKLQAM